MRALRHRADEAGRRLPGGEQPLDIVARHQHIGIGEDDPSVPRRLPAAHAIVKLRVGAHPLVADDQARRDRGIGRDQLLQDRHDRIVAAGDAKDDLVGRIIEIEA